MSASWPCPGCGYLTLSEPAVYDLCPVCFWEDHPHQTEQPQSRDGADGVSLTEGRSTYQRIGAMAPVFLAKVRPPTADEVREREQRTRKS